MKYVILFLTLTLALTVFAAEGKQVTYKRGEDTVSAML